MPSLTQEEMMTMRDSLAKLREENNGKLPSCQFPGGYTLIYYDEYMDVLCSTCANKEGHYSTEVVAFDGYPEGPTIPCNDCGCSIESDYGDPKEEI